MFVALPWDHIIGAHFVQWIVVECKEVGDKFGLPQALPPRRDIAYFTHPESAESDAKRFAQYKNHGASGELDSNYSPYLSDHHGYCHYGWDHTYLGELIRHAVLYWEDGKHHATKPHRSDIGYFIDPKHSERDSVFFAQYKLGLIE